MNAREAAVEEMVNINSANSDASACCTRGLSDIQKPFARKHQVPTIEAKESSAQ
jgi:hypothetical protein